MADVKITKAMVLEVIKANVENMVFEGEVTAEDVVAYVDVTLGQLTAKAEKAKAKAAEKRAEGDELKAAVQAVLTEEFQNIKEIAGQIEGEDVTNAKVTARLTKLVNEGVAVKEKTKDGMTYKLAQFLTGATE